MKTVSNIAGAARRLLIDKHPDLKLGQGLELVAASLGYKSQSAYKTAVHSGLEAADLSNIRHFQPDLASVAQRAQSLGLSVKAQDAKDAIQEAWRRETPDINL